jgi:hypothetical protein
MNKPVYEQTSIYASCTDHDETDNALREQVFQLSVGHALCVHESHLLATLVADPERLLGAVAAHVDDVHVDLEHVLRLGLEKLGVL